MRVPIIAGNWKMNKTCGESALLAGEIKTAASGLEGVEIVICPTYPALDRVGKTIAGGNVKLGAQDMHWEKQGAYTGKVSADMLLDVGVEYVILGHSEQRTYFHETNETVNKKVQTALEFGLIPIICVGETLQERESSRTEEVVADHIRGAFRNIAAGEAVRCVIAYEPVWAIGTGKTATSNQAQEVHHHIREMLTGMYDEEVAEKIRIQYGGSMKPDNAEELLALADVDGGLIGGASLKADSFLGIVGHARP